ncbi:MAG TPA: phage major capsid protein [Solirubrobacterales bacterium]|nr:phage major capsid protein [Solirubrobacterales bacterium]
MATYNASIGRTETGTGIGSLIPDAERKEILKGVEAKSVVLNRARKITMSTKVERQPVLSALPKAYWVNGDTGHKQTTKAEWKNKFLTAEELAVIVPVPDAVRDDAAYDIFGEVKPLLVEAIAAAFDAAVLFGTEAPATYEESLAETAKAAGNFVVQGTNVDIAEDINQVMAKVEDDGFTVNGFAARSRMKSKLRGLRDKNNQLLFNPGLVAGTPNELYGEPVEFDADQNGVWVDEGVNLFAGDWAKLVAGIRQDLTFQMFTEGVISDDDGKVVLNLMQDDSSALRVVARYAFTVANPISRRAPVEAGRYPFAYLDDGSEVS